VKGGEHTSEGEGGIRGAGDRAASGAGCARSDGSEDEGAPSSVDCGDGTVLTLALRLRTGRGARRRSTTSEAVQCSGCDTPAHPTAAEEEEGKVNRASAADEGATVVWGMGGDQSSLREVDGGRGGGRASNSAEEPCALFLSTAGGAVQDREGEGGD
jgi:hypothetical protein